MEHNSSMSGVALSKLTKLPKPEEQPSKLTKLTKPEEQLSKLTKLTKPEEQRAKLKAEGCLRCNLSLVA